MTSGKTPAPPPPPKPPAPESSASTVRARDARRNRSGRQSTILGGLSENAGKENTFLKKLLGA